MDDANNANRTYSIRSSSVALKANYAIGLYRGNEMYLTPLQGVLQMKPSFKRIDEAFEKKKKKEEEAQPAAVEENDMEDEAKPLQFRVKKRETERQVAMRQQQFQHLKKLEDDENWVKLEYMHKDVSVGYVMLLCIVWLMVHLEYRIIGPNGEDDLVCSHQNSVRC